MEVIFLFGTVQAFFLSFLIFTKKNKSTGDHVLGAWMAFLGVHLLSYYIHSSGLAWEYPHLLGIGVFFPMLEGPFMFVYVLVLIGKSGRFKLTYLLHGLPFLLVTIYLLFNYYFLTASEKVTYYKIHTTQLTLVSTFVFSLNVFLGPAYVIWSLFKLKKHTKNISEHFSYTDQINLIWLKYVIASFGFVWITVILSVTLSEFFPILSLKWSNRLIYLALTIVIFFLGYFGIKQQAIYNNKPNLEAIGKLNEEERAERYKKSRLSEKKAKEYLMQLLNYMTNEKPYLNNKLSIKDIAVQLNISTNHLSQVINGQLGINFFDFVNNYRINEVKIRLAKQENNQFTLLAIAYDCGFYSKSSFNRIFKKNTGLTPSEFLKSDIS